MLNLKPLKNVSRIEQYHLVVVVDMPDLADFGNRRCEFDSIVFISWDGNVDYYDWSALDLCEVVFWNTDYNIDWENKIPGAKISYLSTEALDILNPVNTPQDVLNSILSMRVEDKPEPPLIKESEIEVHGMVGELARWMTRTAWRPQPKLSLSAALVLVGYLKGRKYITETGVYSNIYVFNVAGSASGKDRPQAAIKFIMSRLNATESLLHPPASGAGFIDALASVDGHGLSVIDEMAEYIAGAANKNSVHQGKVLKYWLEAFTSCSTYIDGERRADASKEKAKRVDRPLFCLLGSTNPDRLTASLRGDDIGSGLLNRFIFVQSHESPRKRKARDFNRKEIIPEIILEKFSDYLKPQKDDFYGLGNEPIVVPFSDAAITLYDKIDDFYEDECQKLDSSDRLRNLYGRAHEYVGKVALILCNDKEISEKDVEVAHQIIQQSVKTAISFCGDITDTREEEDYVKVKSIIKKAKKINAHELCVKTQRIQGGKRRRNEIIEALIEVGQIERRESQTGGRPSVFYIWK